MDRAQGLGRQTKAAVSERWATLSTPRAFRKTKTLLLGPGQMPDDPLKENRREVNELHSLVSTISTCGNTIRAAIEMLTSAPEQMVEPLRQFYTQDVPGNQHIARLCTQLQTFASRTQQDGESHLTEMQEVLHEMMVQTESVKGLFHQRDLELETQLHYDVKCKHLRDQLARSPSAKITEKLVRNENKKRHSEENFQKSMDETVRGVNEVLATRWQKTGLVLSKLCRYYVVMFTASEQLTEELADIADKLVGKSATDHWLKKAQELKAQTGERFSQFASDFCGKA